MDVQFAPDWSHAVPYQRLLAAALADEGVNIRYLRGYKRILPLSRLLKVHPCELLHLHWPEAYYPAMRDRWDWFRRARFRLDLVLAARRTPYVLTAHNLHEHNLQDKAFGRANYAAAFQWARLIFAHSEAAREALINAYRLAPEVVKVIPSGDLSVALPPPISKEEARKKLGLSPEPLCLVFGAVEPYKGQEEVLAWWKRAKPAAQLAIVGKPHTLDYQNTISRAANGLPNVTLRFGWLSDDDLAVWLSAADCTVFNYRTIFTSGAAGLARSYGTPMVLPARLQTLDLHEPDPRVIRFESFDGDFGSKLQTALAMPPGYAEAASWREATSWKRVAQLTVEGYRTALGKRNIATAAVS